MGEGITFDLMDKNTIFLNGEINNRSANQIVKQLLFISLSNKESINIFIRSEGGELDNGLAIINTMRLIPNKCNTISIGETCSMASFILAAGEKGHRYILPLSSVMIHQVQAESIGSIPEMEAQMVYLREKNDLLLKEFAKDIGKPLREVKRLTNTDNWLSAEEALSLGIVDRIIRRYNEIK